MKSLGLIGLGAFGRLTAETLKPHFDILAHDAADHSAEAKALGVGWGSLAEAASREVVIVAVPVRVMRDTFEAIAPHVRPGALVVDVGSVKMLPARWMLETLPEHADIVATHPLFGPQSAQLGLAGQRLVICPVRGDRHHAIAALAQSLGLIASITTPEEHDREMAYVQALTHLIGRTLAELDIPDEDLATSSYQHLLELMRLIRDDSFDLFTAIQTMNPFAREVAERFVEQAESMLVRARARARETGA